MRFVMAGALLKALADLQQFGFIECSAEERDAGFFMARALAEAVGVPPNQPRR